MGIKNKVKKVLKKIKKTFTWKIKEPIKIPVCIGDLLKERTIIITGGASGIGYEIAKLAINNKANVIICGRNEKKLKEASLKLKKETNVEKEKVFYYRLDISNKDTLEEEFSKIVLKHKVDTLVNNAGISIGSRFLETNISDLNKTINTNLEGTYNLSQIFSRYLIKNKIKGNVLNISSISGYRPAISPYMLSKWGINGLTKGMAKMLIKYGIIVNGIAPGPTITSMIEHDENNLYYEKSPSERFLDPVEVANLAIYLISDMGRMIVGETIPITGGCGNLTYDDIEY